MWGHNKTSGTRTRRMRNRWVSAAAFAAVAAVALTACAPSSDAAQIAALELHPTGPDGAWIDDAYANGSSESYVTEGYVCSLQDGVVAEWHLDNRSIVATSITTGEVVWQRADSVCIPGAPQLDAGLIVVAWSTGADAQETFTQELLDPVTGETRSVLPWPYEVIAQLVGSIDDVLVLVTSGRYVGLRDNEIVWESAASATEFSVVLDDRVIGSTNIADGTVTLIDGTTGDTIADFAPDAGHFGWATDGLLLLEDDDASTPTSWDAQKAEYQMVDLSGTEVGRVSAVTNTDIVPGWRAGVTLPLADYVDAPTVYAVAQDGTPALFTDSAGKTHTKSGEINLTAREVIAVSTSGSLLLFDDSTGPLTLINATGKAMSIGDESKGGITSIRDGYIVTGGTGPGARILIPNAE